MKGVPAKINILIKGLEIPENGYLDVRILNHGSIDAVTSTGSHPYYIAHDVVVLPEKHGRLIFDSGEEYEIN